MRVKEVLLAALLLLLCAAAVVVYARGARADALAVCGDDGYMESLWEPPPPPPPKDVFVHVQEAVDAIRGPYWQPWYADLAVAVADVAAEAAGHGEYPMDAYDLADNLVVFAWWETSFEPRAGGIGEMGYTQVMPCDSTTGIRNRIRCDDSGFVAGAVRPTREWLMADPRNALRWTAGKLQSRRHGLVSVRAYNGGGPIARAYARRHMGAIARIHEWRERPRQMAPMPRGLRNGSVWLVPVTGEPGGAW